MTKVSKVTKIHKRTKKLLNESAPHRKKSVFVNRKNTSFDIVLYRI